MKKSFTLLTFLLCSLTSWAQIPAGYYSTATGTGLTLKTQLKKIIDIFIFMTSIIKNYFVV